MVPHEAAVPDAAEPIVEASVPTASSLPDAAPDAAPDASQTVPPPDAAEAGPDGAPDYTEMCSALPAAPVAFEALPGFTSSEDFVFDELGNYVGIDGDNNLVRISKSGKRELWAAQMGSTAGMGMLPDGSVIICDVGEGALKRVYPDGYIHFLLSGLAYPNGMDIGPDGYIYVAENSAGRVRRVDPDSGAFTFVAVGLYGSNGVAFSSDPNVFYVGSFEGSGVYKVVLSAPGELGTASVFARPNGSTLPEPEVRCPEQQVGVSCTESGTMAGACQPFANIVDCLPTDPCPELEDGQYCDFPKSGTCNNDSCIGACEGLAMWAECQSNYGGSGVCAPSGDGSLECRAPRSCDQLEEGDACDYYSSPGVCTAYGPHEELNCRPVQPCDGLDAGDACQTSQGGEGTCTEQSYYGGGIGPALPVGAGLICVPPPPCEGLTEGDACENEWGESGTCGEVSYSLPGKEDAGGDASVDGADAGAGPLSCVIPDPCDNKIEGDACTTGDNTAGTCIDYYGFLSCQEPPPCEAHAIGDSCTAGGQAGVCVLLPWSTTQLQCVNDPCVTEGDDCSLGFGLEGVCVEGELGPTCDVVQPCEELNIGDACEFDYQAGVCAEGEFGTYCEPSQPCDGLEEGDACEAGYGDNAVCVLEDNALECRVPQPCDGLDEGDVCEDYFGAGTCGTASYGYGPYPSDPPVLVPPTSPAISVPPGALPIPPPGPVPSGGLTCLPPSSCEGLEDGSACQSDNGFGTCSAGHCGNPGGIDGLGVDVCGNVYASEFTNGNLWRISPAGDIERIADLPSGWIPNIKWGRDVGGFSSDVMYVADRDQGRLFGMSVGVPSAPEFYDAQ